MVWISIRLKRENSKENVVGLKKTTPSFVFIADRVTVQPSLLLGQNTTFIIVMAELLLLFRPMFRCRFA